MHDNLALQMKAPDHGAQVITGHQSPSLPPRVILIDDSPCYSLSFFSKVKITGQKGRCGKSAYLVRGIEFRVVS